MWKIIFEYHDKSKVTITGCSKEISDDLIRLYCKQYGRNAEKATYQQYPKKDHQEKDFFEMCSSD